VVWYLKTMHNLELTYNMSEATIVGYTDADHASQLHWHSISGYTFCIGGGAVSWSSKKQPIVTLSTTEAKYVVAMHATKEAKWLRALMTELISPQASPTTIYCDNQSAIALSKDGQHHAWTKHIDVRFHFVREAISDGTILLSYCPTQHMTADILTKPLSRSKTEQHVGGLGLLPA